MPAAYAPSQDMRAFLAQNSLCGSGMTFDQIQHADELGLVTHHSGGLLVLQAEINEGTSKVTAIVKMHDSWGPEYEVVVHTYDPDAEDPDSDSIEHVDGYDDPRDAANAFFALTCLEME